ncbi:hypothetical protein FAZ69_30465 [Trinickia terrae]|uniref:Uncharacterized protein n=1 Tax=Trinickia terrae TaxID=2571161 RepID=A0A4U1HE16_9BURK|nr:hypothetical protein [Trinickia terrae]TKC79189.1 hypothetical protein FAZ69_30465 [Trinickia terrae]
MNVLPAANMRVPSELGVSAVIAPLVLPPEDAVGEAQVMAPLELDEAPDDELEPEPEVEPELVPVLEPDVEPEVEPVPELDVEPEPEVVPEVVPVPLDD